MLSKKKASRKARFFCYIIFFSNSSMYAQACSMEFVGYNHCGFCRCGNGIGSRSAVNIGYLEFQHIAFVAYNFCLIGQIDGHHDASGIRC